MTYVQSDLLGGEALSPLNGSPLVLLTPSDRLPEAGVNLLIDRRGDLPSVDLARYDAAVTTRGDAPPPWITVDVERIDSQLAAVRATAAAFPIATTVLSKVLRLGEQLDFETALELESFAYSTLLGGGEFAGWLSKSRPTDTFNGSSAPVRYERDGGAVTLVLASPGNRNAMTATMRDALYEALVNVLEDPSSPSVTLHGEGRCFSTGGDLGEFGSARDIAVAHVIRSQRSCARILYRLGSRAIVRLHGACIGSGIEVAAAAARRTAAHDLMVQLPELRMGLIPGAGGTVTLTRAMGRQRLFWLALGAFRMGARQALNWGLIDAIEQ